MRKIIFLILLLSAIILFIFIMLNAACDNLKEKKVCFQDNCFIVELAETPEQRYRGLMFREKMDTDKGMLFIFEQEGEHSFWMKNTLIALDIIYINQDREVVFIERDAQPCGDGVCKKMKPGRKAKYVLELNAGTTDRIGLEIGDKFVF
jgi:uncharacterized membrane protein (UPF0127 family)